MIALVLAAIVAACVFVAAAVLLAEPVNQHERAQRGGVKLWRLPGGFKVWVRDTRIRGVVSYDPRVRLWLPSRRVAILLPGNRERASKVIRRRRKERG